MRVQELPKVIQSRYRGRIESASAGMGTAFHIYTLKYKDMWVCENDKWVMVKRDVRRNRRS